MAKIEKESIVRFVGKNIQSFHKRRLDSLLALQLNKILKRKNPYLLKAKALNTAHDLVKTLLDAHLSSQEEGIFGDFLESLALFICGQAFGGKKSSAEGIDLEFDRDGVKHIVSIKSGPNWGNSRQIARMKDDFKKAKKILRTSISKTKIVAINGCCCGKDDSPDKGDYQKYCGQRFWEFVSGDEGLYTKIVEPLGDRAKERNEKFSKEYAKVVNKFTIEFAREYCAKDGSIMWKKLVKFNSGKKS
ncbi:MAG: PmeII family type II restriction endonuclease [Candidatus Eisenbacteria bacterium]|nr:PmeII family type II restriction endonuclease [Candidatus Eisenbacteria bacterium]